MIFFVLGAAALGQESRDEDVFGPPAAPPAEPPPPPTPLDERTTDAQIAGRLDDAEQRLVMGGQLWLRADFRVAQDQDIDRGALANPNLLDVFADARPNDRVRGYALARLRHDMTVDDGDTDFLGEPVEPSAVVLDQLWVKWDAAHRVFFTAGRQRIKWGAGRFWNPTDFLNARALDPLAVYDERTGVALLKVHAPFESLGANLYAVANVEGADTPRQVGGALRAEWLVGQTEVSASAAARRNDPVRLGADVSTGLGPLDVHVEGAVRHGDEGPFWRGTLDWEELISSFGTEGAPRAVDRTDDWIAQVVAGAELGIRYGDDDAIYLGAEGFWNDAGYADADLYPWLLYGGGFQPFYLGRAYGAAYASLPSPGRWDHGAVTLSALSNLSDVSGVVRGDVRWTALTHLQANVYGQVHLGDTGGGEFAFALDVPPVPGVLDDGLSIPPPLFDVGAGARVSF